MTDRDRAVRLRASVSGHARAAIAGRDVHVHYEDAADVTRRGSTPDADGECPYPGLAAFTAEQSRWFFGRDALTARLVERAAERLDEGGPLVVVAPSGAGKSSLLRAGLLAAVDRGALPVRGSPQWPRLVLTPTDQPVHALVRALADRSDIDTEEIRDRITSPRRFVGALREWLAGRRIIIVVDQLEELFALCTDEPARQVFLGLLDAIAERDGCGLVVYGLRIDAYSHCAAYPRLRDALQDGQILVGPMTEAELRQAVLFPARSVGLDVEPGLVELLSRDLCENAEGGYEAGRLPLLAHALRAVWRERHGHVLTVAGYRAAGGIRNAVATTAERVYLRLDAAARTATRALFLRLVKIGEGTDDTRRTVSSADLRCDPAVLDAFTDARLLTRARDTVAITHEALLRAWPRLRGWIDEDRAGNLLRQKLEEAASAWDRDDRDPTLLWRGGQLEAVRVLTAEDRPAAGLNERERAFLDACLDLERDQRAAARRRTRRLKQFIALLTALVLVLAGTATYAVIAERRADEARTRAVVNEAAMKAVSLVSARPELAVELAHAAYRVVPTPETRDALLTAHLAMSRIPRGDTPRHTSGVRIGRAGRVAVAGEQDAVVLWRVLADHAVPGARPPEEPWRDSNAFVTEDVVVLGVGDDTEVWDVGDPDVPRRIATVPGRIDVRSASSDGRVLLGYEQRYSDDGRAGLEPSLWDVSAAPRKIELPCDIFEGLVRPDGQVFATTCADDSGTSVRFWRITGDSALQPIAAMPLGTPVERELDYSTRGDYLVVTDPPDRQRVRILDVSDESAPRPWSELSPGGTGYTFSFTEEDRTLVAHDGVEVSFWSLANPARPERLATVRTVYPLAPMPVYRPEFGDYVYADGQELWRLDRDVHSVTDKICRRDDLRLGDDDWRRFLPDVDRVPVCPQPP